MVNALWNWLKISREVFVCKGGFLNIGGFFEYWRGVFGQSHFFKNMGGILNIEGGFLNIGGFLDNLIFSKIFFYFFVPEAK